MSVAIVTGSSGLIGSETARFFHQKDLQIVGIDNNMRQYFFGADGSIEWNTRELKQSLKNFTHYPIDIRNQEAVLEIFKRFADNISVVIHTAAQPSHDWAAREPITDFTVNANGTLILLEATRLYCPDATFIFTSTNKVYGDAPNLLPLVEHENRWEIDESHQYFEYGIDETMSIDQSKHSLFGVSKVAADVLVQEYGRYFDLKTGTFRGGCLTGPGHSGAELHGFLAYLAKCAVTNKPYTIYGYSGKQVRDNIHSYDLVNAFWHFYQNPRTAAVYNMGGSRHSNCSVLEAIQMIEELSGKSVRYEISDQARSGDHIWWISDIRRFQNDYPQWSYRYDLRGIVQEILEATMDRTLNQGS
jgi:CDP-paratose 2-epimerase